MDLSPSTPISVPNSRWRVKGGAPDHQQQRCLRTTHRCCFCFKFQSNNNYNNNSCNNNTITSNLVENNIKLQFKQESVIDSTSTSYSPHYFHQTFKPSQSLNNNHCLLVNENLSNHQSFESYSSTLPSPSSLLTCNTSIPPPNLYQSTTTDLSPSHQFHQDYYNHSHQFHHINNIVPSSSPSSSSYTSSTNSIDQNSLNCRCSTPTKYKSQKDKQPLQQSIHLQDNTFSLSVDQKSTTTTSPTSNSPKITRFSPISLFNQFKNNDLNQLNNNNNNCNNQNIYNQQQQKLNNSNQLIEKSCNNNPKKQQLSSIPSPTSCSNCSCTCSTTNRNCFKHNNHNNQNQNQNNTSFKLLNKMINVMNNNNDIVCGGDELNSKLSLSDNNILYHNKIGSPSPSTTLTNQKQIKVLGNTNNLDYIIVGSDDKYLYQNNNNSQMTTPSSTISTTPPLSSGLISFREKVLSGSLPPPPKPIGRLEVELDAGYFISGHNVSGKIHLYLAQDTVTSGIVLKWKGIEHVILTHTPIISTKYNNVISLPSERIEQKKVLYENRDMIYNTDDNDMDTITKGIHTFPFSFKLPSHLPSSYCNSSKDKHTSDKLMSAILYNLTVFLENSNDTMKIKKSFIVTEPVTIASSINPIKLFKEKKKSFLCAKGTISFRATVQNSVFMPGDIIPIQVSVDNSSSRNIDFIKVELKRKELIKVPKSTDSNNTITKKSEFKVFQKFDGVGSHSTYNNTLQFDFASLAAIQQIQQLDNQDCSPPQSNNSSKQSSRSSSPLPPHLQSCCVNNNNNNNNNGGGSNNINNINNCPNNSIITTPPNYILDSFHHPSTNGTLVQCRYRLRLSCIIKRAFDVNITLNVIIGYLPSTTTESTIQDDYEKYLYDWKLLND